MGFEKLNPENAGKALDLSGFEAKVSDAPVSVDDVRIADRVAERHGLAVEPVVRVKMERTKSVRDRVMIEGPIEVINRYKLYCKNHDIRLYDGLVMFLDMVEKR